MPLPPHVPENKNAEAASIAILDKLTPEQRAVVLQLQADLKLPPDEINDMVEAILRGETIGEYYGYTPEICNAIENIALAYYRSAQYEVAIKIFAWLADMTQNTRASAWRGIGACYQAIKAYPAAIPAYQVALTLDPSDTLSMVYCGECMCYMNDLEHGHAMLQQAIDTHVPETAEPAHIQRARAIIKNQPPSLSSEKKNDTQHPDAVASHAPKKTTETLPKGWQQALEKERIAHSYDEANQIVLEDPQLQAKLERLTLALSKGEITLRQVGDFPEEHLEAGYDMACQFLDHGDPLNAMETVGWLLWLDSHNPRYYQLAAISLHHLKLWCLADYFYSMAQIYAPDDAVNYIYQGEVKVMLEEKQEALTLLHKGIDIAKQDPELQELQERGETLLQKLSEY